MRFGVLDGTAMETASISIRVQYFSQSCCSLKRLKRLATRAAQFEVRTGTPDELELVHASKNGDADAFLDVFEQLRSERS